MIVVEPLVGSLTIRTKLLSIKVTKMLYVVTDIVVSNFISKHSVVTNIRGPPVYTVGHSCNNGCQTASISGVI